MQQWEHATNIMAVSIIKEEQMLEEYGKAGWQLCALYVFDKEFIKYYFKRPIPQPSAAEKIFKDAAKEAENEIYGGGHMEVKTTL